MPQTEYMFIHDLVFVLRNGRIVGMVPQTHAHPAWRVRK
jgi:hypothetical protein